MITLIIGAVLWLRALTAADTAAMNSAITELNASATA